MPKNVCCQFDFERQQLAERAGEEEEGYIQSKFLDLDAEEAGSGSEDEDLSDMDGFLAEDGVEDDRGHEVRDLAEVAAVLLRVLLREAAHHLLGVVGRDRARHRQLGVRLELGQRAAGHQVGDVGEVGGAWAADLGDVC